MKKSRHEVLNIYKGILNQNKIFQTGEKTHINFDFSHEKLSVLKEEYQIEKIAKKGSDFIRATNLLKYFSPRLAHSSWYANHIEMNSLALLEYSFNNKEQGINCLSKSKILSEALLSIGIYARRVFIMPYSAFDFDNHVVVEYFDRKFDKWVMIDPTTNGYMIDKNNQPLGVFEIRNNLANDEFVTFKKATERIKDVNKLFDKHIVLNAYYAKNMFYFLIDQDATFGVTTNRLLFSPIGFNARLTQIENVKYRIKNLSEKHKQNLEMLENHLDNLMKLEDFKVYDIKCVDKI